ncbi:hypothetical protein LTR95_003309 [Oleoguttula sp. CCFEE 5521]
MSDGRVMSYAMCGLRASRLFVRSTRVGHLVAAFMPGNLLITHETSVLDLLVRPLKDVEKSSPCPTSSNICSGLHLRYRLRQLLAIGDTISDARKRPSISLMSEVVHTAWLPCAWRVAVAALLARPSGRTI